MITLLSGTRRAQDRGNVLEFFGTGQKNIKHYWPLTENFIDYVGGNTLTGTVTSINRNGALFNGTSDSLQTSNSINLTATQKVTMLADLEIVAYETVNIVNIMELSVQNGLNPGSFVITMFGTTTDDPITVGTSGNVGQNTNLYLPSLTRMTDNRIRKCAFTFDFTKANETAFYEDGSFLTPSSSVVTSNNTGLFGNFVLYFASRAGTSRFSNIRLRNLALLNTVDADLVRVFPEYVAWSNDTPVTQYWTFTDFQRGHVIRHRGRIKKIWKDDILVTQQEALEEKAAEIALDEIREEKAKLEKTKTEKEIAFTEAEIAEIRLQKDFLEKQKQILIAMLIMLKDEMEDEDDINTLLMLL